MKKIPFDDRFALTNAVLQHLKNMTRRAFPKEYRNEDFVHFEWNADGSMVTAYRADGLMVDINPQYKVGEIVAVSQKYGTICRGSHLADCEGCTLKGKKLGECKLPSGVNIKSPSWNNKMFVRADLMPHQIRIADIRIERLQDISNEDCLSEGVMRSVKKDHYYFYDEKVKEGRRCYWTPREAFAVLIDKVSGKGTWQHNPWVFVYEFELVK